MCDNGVVVLFKNEEFYLLEIHSEIFGENETVSRICFKIIRGEGECVQRVKYDWPQIDNYCSCIMDPWMGSVFISFSLLCLEFCIIKS